MSPKRPSLGILLPTRGLLLRQEVPHDAEWLLDLARGAEDGGVDSVWVGDSLTAKPRLEPLTVLAAVAARTQRVRVGTAVLLAALRHPLLSAHILGTLDVISGGRLILAAGVGGAFVEAQQREWRAAGVAPQERAERLEEWVPLVKRLTRGDTVSFVGHHFSLDEVAVRPRSPQPNGVPLLLATHWRTGKDRQHRRAVRLADGIIGISDSPAEFARLNERLEEIALEEGRSLGGWKRAFYMTVNLNEDESLAEREADSFIRSYYGINMWKDLWGPFGHPDRVAGRLQQYADAGADTVIVRFASPDQQAQLETFLERVKPRFREAG